MPYLCGSNQRFTNLVSSDFWKSNVEPKVEENGFKALFYVNIDPRVVAVRKGGAGAVITPGDLAGVKFRVPGSKMLQQYYRMVGANPTPVAWGETPSAIKQGVADALDPSVGALHVFGFGEILSHVTFTQAVPDSQVYSCNLEWFNSMPADVQDGIVWGSEMTAHQNLSKVPSARAYAMAELTKAGVEFHSLSEDQLGEWKEAGGFQRLRMGRVQSGSGWFHGQLCQDGRSRWHPRQIFRPRRIKEKLIGRPSRRPNFLDDRRMQVLLLPRHSYTLDTDMDLLRQFDRNAERWLLLIFYVMLVITMAIEVLRREIFSYSSHLGRRDCAVFFHLPRLDWCGCRRKRACAYPH